MNDPYEALAAIYDEWQERYGPFWELALPRLVETLERHGTPAGARPTFVDLGCGTGALLFALRERYPAWSLVGVDDSASMLAAAAGNPGAGDITWLHRSFTEPFADGAGAAGAFFDAFNHAVAPGALAATFSAVARSLAPGGLLVFDLNNQRGVEAWWGAPRVYTGSGWTLTMDASFDPATRLARGRAVVDRLRPTRRHITEVTERCFEDAEVAGSLEAAGLSVELVEPWKPLHDDIPGKTWWVARRR
jgi:SAM-dependent methyltransferase